MTFSVSTELLSEFLVFPTWVLTCLGVKFCVPALNWGGPASGPLLPDSGG